MIEIKKNNCKNTENSRHKELKSNLCSRSIFENPKQNDKVYLNLNSQDGFITPFWNKKIERFFNYLIPQSVLSEKKIFLTSSKQLLEFLNKLEDSTYDLSNIEYVCITSTISDIYDIIDFFTKLRAKLPNKAKVIYTNYNWKWKYLFKLSSLLGFSKKRKWGNLYRDEDLDCFLHMSGWENVQKHQQYITPFDFGVFSKILDNLFRLPILNMFTLNTIFIARGIGSSNKQHSVTVLIPCKDEENNIEAIVKRTTNMGERTELLFINDMSTDSTEKLVLECKEKYSNKNIKLIQGKGKGKGEAIREGMKFATGDICMILDADLTVIPEDLPQFYDAINSRRADFINGTRLIYPQENDAMRPLNIIGNIIFSIIFSYLIGQRITDTLCGTKVFWKNDWILFEEMKALLKDSDVWGDYNLIFGAARFGLKIGELPVRYFQRLEGLTKMTKRFKNGLIMLNVAWHALWKVKFLK